MEFNKESSVLEMRRPGVLRPDLPELPRFIKSLPVHRGYPVPWFVDWVDGEPEFRAMDRRKFVRAVNERLCWVCGQKLFAEEVFVIGPICAINRISSEPPAHRECAQFSARACPFLSRPGMVRRPDDRINTKNVAGMMIERNPGVTLLWFTRRHTIMQVTNGVLFQIGHPFKLEWYREGRAATRAEIMESINTGLPALRDACDRDPQPGAHEELDRQIERGLKLVRRR